MRGRSVALRPGYGYSNLVGMKILSAILGLCIPLALLACGEGDSATTSQQESGWEVAAGGDPPFATIIAGEGGTRPTIDPPDRPPPKRLLVRDLEKGWGPVARRGDLVAVHYVGFDYETGEVSYPGNWPPYPPAEFRLGSGGNGAPFEEGIEGMRADGLREIVIPPHSAYGPNGTDYVVAMARVVAKADRSAEGQAAVPGERSYARASDVELNSYQQKGPFAAIVVKGDGKKPNIEPPDRPAPKKLLFRDLEKGSGPAARRGDEVIVHYDGAMYDTGEVRYGGRTQISRLGFDGWGKAFEEGIEGMKEGGRRELIVPSRFLGGSGTVDYVIELTRLAPASE